jgi:phosphonate transport system substrate-binding protein
MPPETVGYVPPMTPNGEQPTFAHDANLGFPVDDPRWREFFDAHQVRLAGYRDMESLTNDLRADTTAFCYLPAGNYYYLRDDPSYEGVAIALYAADETTMTSSLLVAANASGIDTVEQLRGKRLAYAHAYCTTSYFAPALLLAEHGDSIRDFFGELVQVPAWQPQIDAVLDGRAEATMVQENVWLAQPSNAQQATVLGRKDHLPTPVVIVDKNGNERLNRELAELLLSHRPAMTPTTLFRGFVPYAVDQVEAFFTASARALS